MGIYEWLTSEHKHFDSKINKLKSHGCHFEFGQLDHVKYMLQIKCQKHVQLPQPKFSNKEITIGPLID